jgi:hypothetical protein
VLAESDSRQFSRALSGFANSDGGVLLWGIETVQHEEASALKPIAQVHDFLDRLKKSILNSTQPVVDGVLLDVVYLAGSTTDGYVKCLIPASDKTPHRAMQAGREYFKRTEEGFYKLEHFDLEDMFGRRPRPSLTMRLELRPRPGEDPYEEVEFAVLNEGRGSARYFGFFCAFHESVRIADARLGLADNTAVNRGRPTVSYSDNVGVIHPNGIWGAVGQAIIQRAEKGKALVVEIRWYCDGMAARTRQVTISPEASAVSFSDSAR